ncbi:unnamed protein product [Pieris brassicae]|uniref:Uncharacterized protein n=1 Tax=Pieris brassicae TaxID=7116 RepID=A0A9P0TMT9_PIEBR|nr:unnamed protein product [Pieris brassicae]
MTTSPTYSSGASSADFRAVNHLKRSNEEYVLNITDEDNSTTTKRKNKYKPGEITQEQFNENILKFFINSNISLDVINDPFFKKIFNGLNITERGLNLIPKNILTILIEDCYDREIRAIKHDLSNAKNVRVTVTYWPATKKTLEVTANWIDSSLQLKRKKLAYRIISTGTKSQDDYIKEIHAEFGIDHHQNLISVNVTNLVNVFMDFALDIENTIIRYTDENIFRLPSGPKKSTLNCNLASTTVKSIPQNTETRIKDVHNQVIEKCTNLWNCIGQPKFDKIIHRITGRTICKPKLSWSILYDPLKQILSIQDKIPQLYKELKLKIALNDNDFKYIDEYLRCLNPIADAVDKIQDDSFKPGMFLPCLVSLRNKLIKLNKVPFVLCKKIAETYLEVFETRFSDYLEVPSPLYLALANAALAHPYFKDKWMTCLHPEYELKIRAHFKATVVKNVLCLDEKSQEQNKDAFFDFDIVTLDEDLRKYKLKQLKADSIISRYLGDSNTELNMLTRYPEMDTVFNQYNNPMMFYKLLPDFEMINLLSSRDNLFEKRLLLKSNMCR